MNTILFIIFLALAFGFVWYISKDNREDNDED